MSAAAKDKIVFADPGWDSVRFHNGVAQTIIEEGYGYPTEVIAGSTAATFLGLIEGDIDVYMEIWTANLGDTYYDPNFFRRLPSDGWNLPNAGKMRINVNFVSCCLFC